MKFKDFSEKINNSEKLVLNVLDFLKLDYEYSEENYDFINENIFLIKKYYSKIKTNTIKYFIQIIFAKENKSPNFLEEINSLITKKFCLFLIKNFKNL